MATGTTGTDRWDYRIKRDEDTEEWVVLVWKDGERYPDADYFTDDKDDAIGTMADMKKRDIERAEGKKESRERKEAKKESLMAITFWAYKGIETDTENGTEANAYFLVSLESGESFEMSSGGLCEEGYHREQTRFVFDGDVVTREEYIDAVDCDGRISETREYYCEISDLRGIENPDGVKMPSWQLGSSSVRDFEAERAGY